MIEKYRKATFEILLLIPLFISILLIESFILPQKTINDELIAYNEIYVSGGKNKFSGKSSRVFIGYKFFTKKGNEFSIQKTFINENEITIKQSYIFKNITIVKSKTKDYSGKLMSGFNGACLYLTISLTISAIISLLFLKFDENLSENGFQNIILLNSFLTICTLYIMLLQN